MRQVIPLPGPSSIKTLRKSESGTPRKNTLNGWCYPEAVLVKAGLSRALIHPKRLAYYSSWLGIYCNLLYFFFVFGH